MQIPTLSQITGRSFAACVLSASAVATLCAQDNNNAAETLSEAPVQLDRHIVSATRVPTDPKATPSVVTVIDPERLALTQTPDLAAAIAKAPGLNVARTGAVGGPTSIFIRGAGSDHTLLVVDGIRMNTGDASYSNFLGGAGYAGIGRIEILSGPQSTLYGSSALGGVIVLNTTAGCGPVSGQLAATAGSFGTFGGGAELQGGSGNTGYSFSASGLSSDNKRDFNSFQTEAFSSRIETLVTEQILVGLTLRSQQTESEAPGSVGSAFFGNVDTKNLLATAYVEVTPTEAFHSRLTYGWVRQDYTYDPAPGSSPFDSRYNSRDTRNVIDWQNSLAVTDWLSLVGGVTVESEDIDTVSGATPDSYDNDSRAGYLSANLRPAKSLTLLAGLRYDDYDRSGDATTWRTGVSYYVESTATKLRANHGTGFNAPRPSYVLGDGGVFYNPNPTLKPEESEGWDIGFDQTLFKDRATLGVTYFNNDFTNLFIYDFTIPGIVNTGKARSEGVEVALNLTPVDAVTVNIAYTWMEATNDSAGVPLVRRPRHVFDGEVTWQATDSWLIGAGMHSAARRYDGATSAPVRVEDYTTIRLFTAYQFPRGLLAKVRVENLLDENYQEVRGYPSLPLAVHGTVEWRF